MGSQFVVSQGSNSGKVPSSPLAPSSAAFKPGDPDVSAKSSGGFKQADVAEWDAASLIADRAKAIVDAILEADAAGAGGAGALPVEEETKEEADVTRSSSQSSARQPSRTSSGATVYDADAVPAPPDQQNPATVDPIGPGLVALGRAVKKTLGTDKFVEQLHLMAHEGGSALSDVEKANADLAKQVWEQLKLSKKPEIADKLLAHEVKLAAAKKAEDAKISEIEKELEDKKKEQKELEQKNKALKIMAVCVVVGLAIGVAAAITATIVFPPSGMVMLLALAISAYAGGPVAGELLGKHDEFKSQLAVLGREITALDEKLQKEKDAAAAKEAKRLAQTQQDHADQPAPSQGVKAPGVLDHLLFP